MGVSTILITGAGYHPVTLYYQYVPFRWSRKNNPFFSGVLKREKDNYSGSTKPNTNFEKQGSPGWASDNLRAVKEKNHDAALTKAALNAEPNSGNSDFLSSPVLAGVNPFQETISLTMRRPKKNNRLIGIFCHPHQNFQGIELRIYNLYQFQSKILLTTAFLFQFHGEFAKFIG